MDRAITRAGPCWVEVTRTGAEICVMVQLSIVLEGGDLVTRDWNMREVSRCEALSYIPADSRDAVSRFETEDAPDRWHWLVLHLQAGVLTLDDVDLFQDHPLTPISGGLYVTPEGLRGTFVMFDDQSMVLQCLDDEITLTQSDLSALRPTSGAVTFVESI